MALAARNKVTRHEEIQPRTPSSPEVIFPPTVVPRNVREMHLRHPDGHVFRVGRGVEPKK